MSIIETILDRLFDHKTIVNCEKDPYLKRWYIVRNDSFAIFLHKFIRSDEDRALHDHPWPFIVLPLWRGYKEHSDISFGACRFCERFGRKDDCDACNGTGEWRMPVVRRVWPIIGARYRSQYFRHRVELIEKEAARFERRPASDKGEYPAYAFIPSRGFPSWSLFMRFRKCRRWGFWPDNKFKDADQWWKELCE